MSSHRHYKQRDFDFAHQLTTLRRRARLTQEEVALQVGVTEKSIRNWEGGMNYPTESNLRKLIELYLDHDVFAPGQERDEACLFWELLHERNPSRMSYFDERWFATLFTQWQTRQTQQPVGHQPDGGQPRSSEQPSPAPLPTRETAKRGTSPSYLPRRGWSEAPDVSAWYGRMDELSELEHWLLVDQCRLVAVLGIGGIGKTVLAVKLVEQVAPHFDFVLWRSLQNAPSLEELLLDWLPILTEQQSIHPPQRQEQALSLLIRLLQENRCLLVLDNLETIFQEGVLEGRYRQGYEGYAKLIRSVAQTPHQSCLVLTCREKLPDLGLFAGKQASVHMFKLDGLTLSATQQMLQDKGLFGNHDAWNDLVQSYAGNPLALKIVAEAISEIFGGDIAAFLAKGFTTFHEIRHLLTQQFERISTLEQALMYWLAIERELVTLEALQENLLQTASKGEVIESLYSLRSRSLVERGEHGATFTLQPVILEYMTERLVELVSEEIREGKPALLVTHALLQARARDYVRTSQARLILQPVFDKLLARLSTTHNLEEHLERLLDHLRLLPRSQQGYGGGNVINLLVRLKGHIKGRDCSHLTVWQAALQGAEAQDATFVEADMTGSVFLETLDLVVSVAASTTGQYVASGSFNGEIRLWRATDGQPLLAVGGHPRSVRALTFNQEETLLVSGGYDGLVKVWEVGSGLCLRILQGHTKWVHSVAFHPESKLLATGSDDQSIRLWDLATGRCVKVWDKQSSGVWAVAFSPDGRLLAGGTADGIVAIWDFTSEQCLWSQIGHRRLAVPSLAFSPDGALLVSGGDDATVMVWQARSGNLLGVLSEHTDKVYSVTFNAEGLLASGSFDRTIKLWKVGAQGAVPRLVNTLYGHSDTVWATAFGPDGLLVSGGAGGVVKLWQVDEGGESGKCLRTLQGYSRMITVVACTPDGKLLVSGEHNGTVRVWRIMDGQCLRVLSRQAGAPLAVVCSADGRLVASSEVARTVNLWNVESGHCLNILQGHQEEVFALTFSPDGRLLFSGSLDKTIKCWETDNGDCLQTLQGHGNWVWSLACSPDGTLLASGDSDGVVKLWEITSGRCLQTLPGSPKAIVALTFTSDGQTLLSSNAQDVVTMWDVQNGHRLKAIPGVGDTYWPGSVAFSNDGSLLAAASHDRTIKVWDVNRGLLLHTLPSHAGWPRSVAFADQQVLASGTDEGTIQLWEVQTGEHLMTLQSERPYERMNITGVTGITEAQKASLKTLGAIEKDADMKHW